MSPAKRRAAIAVAFALTLVAIWFAPADTVVEVSEPRAAAAPRDGARSAPAPALDVLAIRARVAASEEEGGGLFAPVGWTAPEPATVAAPTAAPFAAAPQAPPLPFSVMGSHEQAGQTTIFLLHNDRTHVVRVGDTVADTYKVESIDGTAMTLRYLPTDQVQTLELGRTLKEK